MRYVGKESQVYWPKNTSQEKLFRKICRVLKFPNIVLLYGWQILKLKTHAKQSQEIKCWHLGINVAKVMLRYQ